MHFAPMCFYPNMTNPVQQERTQEPEPPGLRIKTGHIGAIDVQVCDHRGTICVTCEQGLARSLAGLGWVGRSSPDLRGSFPLDTIAALRYKTHL